MPEAPSEFYSVYEQDHFTLNVVCANYGNYNIALRCAERHVLETGKQTIVIKHCAVVKKVEIVVETKEPCIK